MAALSLSFPFTFFSTPPSFPSSSSPPLLPFLLPIRRNHRLQALQSNSTAEEEEEEYPETSPPIATTTKKKRKLRPSFYDQTVERWSAKVTSQRSKFPWQEVEEAEEEEWKDHSAGTPLTDPCPPFSIAAGKASSFPSLNCVASAPWAHGAKSRKTDMDSGAEMRRISKSSELSESSAEQCNSSSSAGIPFSDSDNEERSVAVGKPFGLPHENPAISVHWVRGTKPGKEHSDSGATTHITSKNAEFNGEDGERRAREISFKQPSSCSNANIPFSNSNSMLKSSNSSKPVGILQERRAVITPWTQGAESSTFGKNKAAEKGGVGYIDEKLKSSSDQSRSNFSIDFDNEEGPISTSRNFMPWEREDDESEKQTFRVRSNTELAERTIPEPELQRVRNVALRMKERIKVGSAGVTAALVESIREKWKEAEVVKLKFEGPPAINMKRTHEILESKTGGLVIWRSGSSLVLYRGMTYTLPCVQSFSEHIDTKETLLYMSKDTTVHVNRDVKSNGSIKHKRSSNFDPVSSFQESSHGLMDTSDIDGLLDELGPRYLDWSGHKPLPVDADLLPSVVPGYKPPSRLLPYKVKLGLRDAEMTYLRSLARGMPPHFALGRNRKHQGLAKAMVKLWEKSLIAKIAIKRSVPNTCNDRISEELKTLTGGVLLSRNKEFIVFYRGNDFLTPSIAEVVAEREKLVNFRQDEEDQARQRASDLLVLNAKLPKVRPVAGTLAETVEAQNHWADEPSNKDREKMMRDVASAKQASLIRFMEKNLAIAREKVRKAEKALAKVQEFLEPAELPSDLETVTDEERFLFRKIGLKMRAFLSVGRRGVFDGTVENMHLNWKHRELVKIIVKGKSFTQAKHIAISLEAESGGVLISLDKTTKGYTIIVYRGKNYQRPHILRPRNLLTRRQALERSIELQRREALKHHISNLLGKIEMMKSELKQMETKDIGEEDTHWQLGDAFSSNDDVVEEGEEAYLEIYQWEDADDNADYDASHELS